MTTQKLPGHKYLIQLSQWIYSNRYFDSNDSISIQLYYKARDIAQGKSATDHEIRLLIQYAPFEIIVEVVKDLIDVIREKMKAAKIVDMSFIKMVNALGYILNEDYLKCTTDLILSNESKNISTIRHMTRDIIYYDLNKLACNIIYKLLKYDKSNVTDVLALHLNKEAELGELLELCAEHGQVIFEYFYEKPEAPDAPIIQ